jgi:hypothetical protein
VDFRAGPLSSGMSINTNRKEAGVNVIMFPSAFCLFGWQSA